MAIKTNTVEAQYRVYRIEIQKAMGPFPETVTNHLICSSLIDLARSFKLYTVLRALLPVQTFL